MSSVIVGMFDTQAAAAKARADLMSAGFSADAVTMTGGSASDATSGGESSQEPHREGAIARFFGGIFGDDEDKSDADRAGYTDTYTEAFKRGSYGVSVRTADESDIDRAEDILNAAGAVDIDERADAWRKEGWTGGAIGTPVGALSGTAGSGSCLQAGATQKLKEVEEELKVGKRAVAKGGVRVFSRVTEVPVSETVRLREEHAEVKRTAVDRPATEADLAAFKEGSIEVRGMAEEAVVSKTARVTGEVEIGKTATERDETIHDTVRKSKVEVEQIGTATSSTGGMTARAGLAGGDAANRDPITGEPGAHPVGTGVGAAAGGVVAGAAAGTVAGPVGTVIGAAVGAVAGGLAGKGVAEKVDPTVGPRDKPL